NAGGRLREGRLRKWEGQGMEHGGRNKFRTALATPRRGMKFGQTASREEYHETTEYARTDHHFAAVARGCAACGRCHRPAKVTQGATRGHVDLRLKHQYPGGWQQNRPPQSERHRDLYERRSLCFCECARGPSQVGEP